MTENIDIVVRERGSRVVQRNLNDIGGSARKSADGVRFLKQALASVGLAIGVREITQLLDSYTQLQNRLRATGLEGRNLSGVYKELLNVSNDTRSSLQGSVELYSRLAISSKELGVSQRELIDFTQSLNQAIKLSGASATEAQAGLIQLSQGLASGALRGDELRSVLEQLPAVADVIAKELNVTRGELRELGSDGAITTGVVIDAFASARQELNDRFGKTIPTISESIQILNNEFTDLSGEFNKATGISALLSRAIVFLAENLETVAKVAISVAAGFALIGGGSAALNAATAAVKALTAAIAANPIGFLLIALTSAITALTLFRDQINLGIDDTTTLGDFLRALGETFNAVFGGLAELAKTTFDFLGSLLGDFSFDFEFSIVGIMRFLARAIDSFIGLWRAAFNVVKELFLRLPDLLTDFSGEGFRNLGKNLGNAIAEGFEESTFAQDFLEGRLSRAQEISRERTASQQQASSPIDLSGGSNPSRSASSSSTSDLAEELENLVGSYDRVFAAQQEYEAALVLLNEAEQQGLISSKRKADVQEIVATQLRDSLDPVRALNEQLDQEQELLKLTASEREVEIQLRAIDQDLRSQGVILGESELNQLRERLTLIDQEIQLESARAEVLAGTIDQQKEFTSQLSTINQLINESKLSREEANQFLVEQNAALLEGTIEAQEALISQYQDTYGRIDELRQADLISEVTAAQLKARVDAQLAQQRLSNAQSFFGTLSNLSRSENKKLARIGKAAAITQATIDGVLGVQKALASAPPPVNFALAAAVGVVAAANVADIASQTPGYAFGGDFQVGGTGGTDSQLVAFRATPDEQVSIRTPAQMREEARQNQDSSTGTKGLTIVNLSDPREIENYLASSSSDEVFINKIESNLTEIRQLVNN